MDSKWYYFRVIQIFLWAATLSLFFHPHIRVLLFTHSQKWLFCLIRKSFSLVSDWLKCLLKPSFFCHFSRFVLGTSCTDMEWSVWNVTPNSHFSSLVVSKITCHGLTIFVHNNKQWCWCPLLQLSDCGMSCHTGALTSLFPGFYRKWKANGQSSISALIQVFAGPVCERGRGLYIVPPRFSKRVFMWSETFLKIPLVWRDNCLRPPCVGKLFCTVCMDTVCVSTAQKSIRKRCI